MTEPFREMRRKKQMLEKPAAEEILMQASSGVLSCRGDGDWPYGVPLNYVYHEGRIYFHSAASGHRMDSLRRDPRVSFTVVGEDRIVSGEYTSYFRSVIVFGKTRVAEGDERLEALGALVEKYSGDRPPEEKHSQTHNCRQALLVAIDVEHMTGKEAIELVRAARKENE